MPRAAQPGMFVDGVTYASIARNLAEGVGHFWAPSYTATVYPVFREHPPLGFALEAGWFAVFGDHLAVERGWSILLGAATAVLLMATWRAATEDRTLDWLPVVFWLLPATSTWAIVNNLLETAQAAFTTAAILAFVMAMRPNRTWPLWGAAGGMAVVCAFLVKGPTGLFPLAAPFVAAALFRDRLAHALRAGAVMIAVTGAAALALLWVDEPRAALVAYWDQQVLASVQGARGGGRWGSIVRHLAAGVAMRMALLVSLAWALARAVRGAPAVERRAGVSRWAWFFLGLAACGSLPVAVSARVSGHYFVPAIPMAALGFAGLARFVLGPTLDAWTRPGSIAARAAGAVGGILLAASLALPLLGITMEPRDTGWVAEYRSLSPALPRAATVGTCEAMGTDWGAHAYLQRFFRVSLDAGERRAHRYFLQFLDRACDPPPGCRTAAATRRMSLLACDAR